MSPQQLFAWRRAARQPLAASPAPDPFSGAVVDIGDHVCPCCRNGLHRIIDDGRIEIDSNVVERSIRPIALNRNYVEHRIMCRYRGGNSLASASATMMST